MTAPPKPVKLPCAISETELSVLSDHITREYRLKRDRGTVRDDELIWRVPLFWFAYYTGMRASELGRLRWEHVDFDKGLVYVYEQKNGKEQTIPLNKKAREILSGLTASKGSHIFKSPGEQVRDRNARYFRERASRAFREARNATGLDSNLSVHSLRHGFCTRLAEAGKPLYVIKSGSPRRHQHFDDLHPHNRRTRT